jgi:uncharacterized protein (TIGR02145 family)
MKNLYLIFIYNLILLAGSHAQVGINTDGSQPDNSAMLDVKSGDKGILIPRMTCTEMNAIPSPAYGLMVYNTTAKTICWYDGGSSWINMTNRDGEYCDSVTIGTKTYHGVIIGTQCWMKENLNAGTAILGSADQTDNGLLEKYCYENTTSNCTNYGGLYQWNEMMQYVTTPGAQGICPAGWHIPTDGEWCRLEMHLDDSVLNCTETGYRGYDAGGKLKEEGTTHWASPNTGATDSCRFTALPGGYRGTTGSFYQFSYYGCFWSSSENSANAWFQRLVYSNSQAYRQAFSKNNGYSVRCIRN